jgi:hypothetical protein
MKAERWASRTIDELKAKSRTAIAIGPFGSRMKSDCYVASGVPVIRGNNISDTRELVGEMVYITSEKAEEVRSSILEADDLFFPHRGAIGLVGIVPNNRAERYVQSTSLMKLTCDRTQVEPLFLFYFFRSAQGRHELLKHASTVGTPGIGQPLSSLKAIRVPCPPLAEQKAIAQVLGALDDKIELNRRMNETLEGLAQSLFKSWFVDGSEDLLSNGWKKGVVGDDFNITMGQSPPGETYNESGEGLPFFQGRADFGARFPALRVYCTAPTRIANPGDTLVCVRAPVGDINMAAQRCCVGRGLAAEAYPNDAFPVIGDSARCVLCQQELGSDAAVRLTRFETFVKENAQKLAQDAKRAVQRTRAGVQAATFTRREQADALGQIRDELDSSAVADELRHFLAVARWRRRLLIRTSDTGAWPVFPVLPAPPVGNLKALEIALGNRISELQNSANTEARRLLEQELQELEDRVWLSSVLDDLRNDIARRKRLAVVSSAIGDTDTTGITIKSTALAKKLVTTALRDRFAREVDRLGVAGLRVELVQTTSEYGVPKFKVSLIANPSAEVGLVLSEGEHRCIALAAFLSELATADDQSGIVFDDPVSSLDHYYRQSAAKRLAEESLNRQVIILTHDIVFLTQIAEEARKLGVCPWYQSVGRGENHCGVCSSDPPMKVRPVLNALDGLQKHLTNVSHAYTSGDTNKWWREVKSIAGDLRELWERAVEQVLSTVYSRFDYGVNTTGLVKVTVLQEQDCHVMRDGYRRCSKLKHSEPGPVGSKPPEPSDLQREIDELRRWLTDILQRQDAMKPV